MRVYLDHAATAPLRGDVLAAMLPVLGGTGGNASSVHWAGAAARAHVAAARAELAKLIGVHPQTLTFTSGATEANNTAVAGIAARAGGSRGEIAVCAAEHSSVLRPCGRLAARGVNVGQIGVLADGRIDREGFSRALCERTLLVSVMWVNNETGVIQPIAELAEQAHACGALFHSDATQALGRVPLDLAACGVDLASFSAHKLGGPQGVGALFVREGLQLEPLLHGGDQERGLRAGSENVAGIAGFGAACAAAALDLCGPVQRMAARRDRLWDGLAKRVPDVERHGSPSACAPHLLQVSFAGASGETLVEALDLAGIAVSSGSACHAGSSEPSHVLQAMGLPLELSRAALRFSLGPDTGDEEIDRVLEVLPAVVARVRAAACAGERA